MNIRGNSFCFNRDFHKLCKQDDKVIGGKNAQLHFLWKSKGYLEIASLLDFTKIRRGKHVIFNEIQGKNPINIRSMNSNIWRECMIMVAWCLRNMELNYDIIR